MSKRTGVSLLETLVVLAILAVFLALLCPAVHAARKRALDAVCRENLHQISFAIDQYAEVNKSLPGPGSNDPVGGWTSLSLWCRR
jgi:prepilin-type N-terminal cleavage/methylation domain-containing protein